MASRLVDVPAEFIRSILCSDDIVKIMLHIYPLFLFWFWYSSCFDDKCWFHTFPNRCSHISMGVLIPLDHRDGHVKFFFNRCPFCSSQVVFVFPHPPTPFLLEPRILNQVSILFMWYFFIHFLQCSYPVILRKMLKSFKFIILLFSILSVDVIQDFGVDLILFPLFTMLSYSGAPINHSPLAIHIRSAQDS